MTFKRKATSDPGPWHSSQGPPTKKTRVADLSGDDQAGPVALASRDDDSAWDPDSNVGPTAPRGEDNPAAATTSVADADAGPIIQYARTPVPDACPQDGPASSLASPSTIRPAQTPLPDSRPPISGSSSVPEPPSVALPTLAASLDPPSGNAQCATIGSGTATASPGPVGVAIAVGEPTTLLRPKFSDAPAYCNLCSKKERKKSNARNIPWEEFNRTLGNPVAFRESCPGEAEEPAHDSNSEDVFHDCESGEDEDSVPGK
ncbi:uncharacterized protein DNG_06271 [Cephalotrichum gorgonifer]|uniref:Uncharacterized protein n=1 Tax=Cephalotrichum gorgonifer TaxID=2041049 RepID=A0AAE8N1A0_9PEZI|nr:uncharacterized protein DNG_06271 [Cephalotrichum gorgonifer]